MFLLLLLLWIILNGRVTVEILWTGALLSALLYGFACRILGFSVGRDLALLRRLPAFLRYVALLLFEILKANRDVMRLILSPRLEPEPQLISVHIPLRTSLGRVLLANSITLTPGTITIALKGDRYLIHCLDREMGEGIEHSAFVRRLHELEGKK